MSMDRRLTNLEGMFRHRQPSEPRQFTMEELDLCLTMFEPPADMPEADRLRAGELCRELDQHPGRRLSIAELDAELAKFGG